MESKGFISLLLAFVVSAVVLFAFIQPIIEVQNQAENIHYNGDNEYCVRMSYGTPEADLYFHKPAGEMVVECRSGSADAEPYYIAPLNSVGQMGWVFCSSSYSMGITGYAPQPMDYTSKYNNQGASGYTSVADEKTVKINATTGKVTTWADDPNNTWNYYDTVDLEHCFWADPEGDYINIQVSNHTTLIEEPTAIAGSSQTQGNYVFYYDTENVITTNSKSAVISTETTEVNGLYKLQLVPMEITGLDDSVNNVTSAHVIVKYKVQGDTSEYSDTLSALIGILPLICGVGLLMIGVTYFLRRN